MITIRTKKQPEPAPVPGPVPTINGPELFSWQMDANKVVAARRPNGQVIRSRADKEGRGLHWRTGPDLVHIAAMAKNAVDFIKRVDADSGGSDATDPS